MSLNEFTSNNAQSVNFEDTLLWKDELLLGLFQIEDSSIA